MFKLNVKLEDKIISGQIEYNNEDGSLDFIPRVNSDISLLISYINIGFDSILMTANQVWGFTPRESWHEEKLTLPSNIQKGEISLEEDFEPGSWRLDKKEMWLAYYDSEQKWLCFGNFTNNSDDKCIEFLKDVVAVIDNEQHLKSLWIKPDFK
ncbi:hypothetical protein QJV15_08495 [Listeria cossartiae subsp. cayugensis]|uniref:hypothetical protein n=1 Tax=Listeria cossartiae TaxID=2838249 RepID=UPI0028809022|nr:hypothetical protein [Listeria cossartiae]MDT0000902.1 hypothetical protein [Listeria cossartiae subsp. cayugensis]MDT0008994.1 hypothetical protein [Listeria cossartiae subsp. cayugensis]MDT0030826.1 hypothetical protein [Listeria cossartiae subsp. cayugensis]MDT0038941.1 hypothetical protein [Listeria cossartiae subsp. cayugensis]MDT0044399.1 hypothetical protein [Listeria cossartiae subsp. cayugensis]